MVSRRHEMKLLVAAAAAVAAGVAGALRIFAAAVNWNER